MIYIEAFTVYTFQATLGSTMSIYSDAGDYDSVDVSGEIVYTVSYDEHTQSLVVFIKECRDLAYGDAARRHCNPYGGMEGGVGGWVWGRVTVTHLCGALA